jgi:hypothetical protein
VFLHDPVGDRQAQPGAAALGFRGEERIVDAREMLGRYADARVGHLDDRIGAVGAGRHREPAPVRHRIAGVEKQIEEDLLQLVLHPAHDDGRFGQVPAHLHPVRPELVLEQRHHVADDQVQVDRPHLAARRARHVQQAAHDLGGAERLALDLLQQPHLGVGGLGPFEQHLREAGNAGQRRVDLVRHAGGQHADGRHLLGQLQLLLEARAIGDVLDHDDPAVLRPFGALERRDRHVDQARALRVLRVGAERHPVQIAASGRLAPRDCQRVDERLREQPGQGAAPGATALDARERLEAAIPMQHLVVPIDDEHRRRQRFDDAVVELPQPGVLVGLALQFSVQPRILERGRRLGADGHQQCHVLAAERFAVGPLAGREHRDGHVLRHARHEARQAGLSPRLGFVTAQALGRLRIVDHDAVSGRQPGAEHAAGLHRGRVPGVSAVGRHGIESSALAPGSGQEQHHPIDVERLAHALDQPRRQPVEIQISIEFARKADERPPVVVAVTVMQTIEAGLDRVPDPGRDEDDDERGEERVEAARLGAGAQHEGDERQREAVDHRDQQQVGHADQRLLDDDLDVHQLVAHDRRSERQRNAAEEHGRVLGERRLTPEEERHQVQPDERQGAGRRTPDDPPQLPAGGHRPDAGQRPYHDGQPTQQADRQIDESGGIDAGEQG